MPTLSITVHIDPVWRRRARAITSLVRHRGDLIAADIHVPAAGEVVELIAHELEHVIEQLDGVDLRAHARRSRATTSVEENGTFETRRAVEAGRTVAWEVKGGAR